jgi:helix-turn-helix protein
MSWGGDTAVTDGGADRPALEEAVRAEIQRLRCERRAAERLVEYVDWQLAEIAGLHPSTVARAERTGRTSYDSLVSICRVLGVAPDWITLDGPAAGR